MCLQHRENIQKHFLRNWLVAACFRKTKAVRAYQKRGKRLGETEALQVGESILFLLEQSEPRQFEKFFRSRGAVEAQLILIGLLALFFPPALDPARYGFARTLR